MRSPTTIELAGLPRIATVGLSDISMTSGAWTTCSRAASAARPANSPASWRCEFLADHLLAPDELDHVPRSEVAKSEQRARDGRRGRAISSHRVERDASQGQASFAATRSLPA